MSAEPWLALLYAQRRAGRGFKAVVREAGSARALAAWPDRRLRAAGLDTAAIRALREPDARVIDRWRAWLEQPGHDLIVLASERYPRLLAEIPDAPLALWTRGRDTSLLAAPQIAIVGSRNATVGGCNTATDFACYLSERGVAVTSGLAVGIDGAGHLGAIEGPGGTLAVLGCGIDLIYPRLNAPLAARIAETGLIVSEYAPGTPVRARQFPARNRIIAGLSLGTLVVEAARRSGSLITARLAGELGREVFAVPGSIHNTLARGCHALIRDGARLVEDGAEILASIAPSIDLDGAAAPPCESVGTASRELDPQYQNLLDLLAFDAIDQQTLVERSGLTAAELSSMLLILELEGYVEALPGGRYARLAKRST